MTYNNRTEKGLHNPVGAACGVFCWGFAVLSMHWSDVSGLKDLDRAMSRLSGKTIRLIGSRALNRAGSQAKTAVKNALVIQTGMKSRPIGRFLKSKAATRKRLAYAITGRGGYVSLHYFDAKETPRGVKASPWNKERVFEGTFMKAGWFPRRVKKPEWNGQVFKRYGGTTREGKDKFAKQRSGVRLPDEMIKDASAKAWQSTVAKVLPRRVIHEIRRETGKAFS